MSRPMRADARRNYARLIDAARQAYAEYGVEARLDDIAKRAGVGPGTLYRHFPTREALLIAVYRDDVEALAGLADTLAADPETLAYFKDVLRGALGRLLVRAQEDGVVRTDVDAADVLRLAHAVGIACEQAPEDADRLLSLVIDGLRPVAPGRRA